MTYRALVGTLLTGLPPNVARELSGLFASASEEADDRTAQLFAILTRLDRLPHEILDQAASRRIVGVNLRAPQKRIADALAELVRQLKDQEGIQETRRRDDKFAKYIAIWDQREGWTGNGYDIGQEQTLRQIARGKSEPTSTIASQYKSAFRLIVGQNYSPELWARIIGFAKVHDCVLKEDLPTRYRQGIVRNERQAPNPSVVAETRLMSGRGSDSSGTGTLLNTIGISADEVPYAELTMDIQTLIARGKDDAAILQELELSSPDARALIQYFRERHIDTL